MIGPRLFSQNCTSSKILDVQNRKKDELWEHMDSMMQEVQRSWRLVVAGDMNGHVMKNKAECGDYIKAMESER